MRNLILAAHPDADHFEDSKIDEYCEGILKIFDENGDGKLSLSEMARCVGTKTLLNIPRNY